MSDLPYAERARQLSELNAALGEALTAWQGIEHILFTLAHYFIHGEPAATSIVFFHIKSAENKVALIDKFVNMALPQNIYQGPWKPLRKRLTASTIRRNAMAHSEITWMNDSSLIEDSEFHCGLSTHSMDVFAARNGSIPTLTVEQLRQSRKDFVALNYDIMRFMFDHIDDWRQRTESLPPNLRSFLEKRYRVLGPQPPARMPESEPDQTEQGEESRPSNAP